MVSSYPRLALPRSALVGGSVGASGLVDAARGGAVALLVEPDDAADDDDAMDDDAPSRDAADVWARAAAFAKAEAAREEATEEDFELDAASEIEASRRALDGGAKPR